MVIQKNRHFRRSKHEIASNFALFFDSFDGYGVRRVKRRLGAPINTIYLRLRKRMAEQCEKVSPLSGELETDESYFGPRRVRGLRGRGAGRKTVVFGLLKRADSVYTEIVPDATKRTLQAIIRWQG